MPATVGRRRFVAGGAAAAGLAVLAACQQGPPSGATASPGTASPGAGSASATPSVSPSAGPETSAAPAPLASASASPSPTVTDAPRLTDRLERYLGGRSGTLGLELVDLRRGQLFRYEAEEAFCYSTIKVLVLTTLLRQLQEDGADLDRRHRRLAERMITRSDNAATETLLAEVGRDEVARVAGLAGMERRTFCFIT